MFSGNHSQASSQGGHPPHQNLLNSGTLALAASMQQTQNNACDNAAANALVAHHLQQQHQQMQANLNQSDSKMTEKLLVSELQVSN